MNKIFSQKTTDSKILANPKLTYSHPLNLHQQRQKKEKYRNFIFIFIILVVFISFFTILIGIYYKNWENEYIIKLSEKIPLPVMLVGKNFISLNDYYLDLKALKIFYAKQNPETPLPFRELKIQIFNKLINQKLMENVAKNFSINVTAAEINQEISLLKESNQDQNLDDLTQESFGWTFSEFIDRIIKYELLANKLNEYFIKTSDYQNINKQKINDYYSKISTGEDFNRLGQTIGWYEGSQIGDQIFSQIKNLSIGQFSNIIETANGYYIFKLTNRVESADQVVNLELSQIFVKKYDLNDYLKGQIEQIKIYRFINI